MQVHTFIAESAADAVAQIRAQLGPQALVLNVRPLPVEGLARFWQQRQIEVLACVPDTPANGSGPAAEALTTLRQEMLEIRQRVDSGPRTNNTGGAISSSPGFPLPYPGRPSPQAADGTSGHNGDWRVGEFLENSGLMPLHAARVVEQLRTTHGDAPPAPFGRELELAASWLSRLWRPATPGAQGRSGTHLLVGPPGVGKTVCLCKWLARTVLVEGRKATVWRLDGRTANTAESLSVYGEILGTPVERRVPADHDSANGELLLIDLPGVNPLQEGALDQLALQINQFPNPEVHLVLNAAYELPILQNQLRAFSKLPLADLIFTHLDEEGRWGKLWNFVLGTNFSIRFLSAGQNIPGDWMEATAGQILARQFPRV